MDMAKKVLKFLVTPVVLLLRLPLAFDEDVHFAERNG